MRVLINASNIKKSGALQVTLSFLEEIKSVERHYFILVISSEVARQLNLKSYSISNFEFHIVNLRTPLKVGYRSYIRKLNSIVQEIQPDCVFSIFGPVYWLPKVPHLAGFAYPWIINPDSKFLKSLDIKRRIKMKLENIFKQYFFKRDSGYLVVETNDVKTRLNQFMGFRLEKIFVVGNTANHHFLEPDKTKILPALMPNFKATDFKLITVTSNFPHKNLKIINGVLKSLQARAVNDVFFFVTISEIDYQQLFGLSNKNIVNLGTIEASQCPAAYELADAMFLPTFLECFSASFPEAMIMKKPIITSDLEFARDICKEAAIYFDPDNADNIADKIIELRNNKDLQNRLILEGIKRVSQFPTPSERAQQYLSICESIVFDKAPVYAV